ncbi:MAG TPA: hypothetical protein VMG12_17630 [Polyangiaceae bacterium]|nr:hypothetical protein [Polyangiaceae bacterium]
MAGARDPFWNRLLEVSDVLVYSFDFEVLERPLGVEAYATEAPWLPAFVVPDATVSVVGRNGMGAVYASCQRDAIQCCLHIDPRGTVVRVGDDLQQVVALVVALPYWPELLAQYPGGGLSALRDVAQRLEREACDDFLQLPAAREELQTFLQLPTLADPVRHLYELAFEQPPVTVWSPHGWRYESQVLRGWASP